MISSPPPANASSSEVHQTHIAEASSDALLLSVCVAVYNVKPYLRECLEKLKGQTLRQAEFIVVDDGSTDGSAEICDEFARSDPRFRVIHHDGNRGLLVARKTGMEAARGKYTTFLDGDDYYTTPESLATLVQTAEDRDVDVLRYECECFGNDEGRVKGAREWTAVNVAEVRQSGLQAAQAVYAERESAWCLAFNVVRTSVVKQVAACCPDEHFICAEDAFLLFVVFFFAKSRIAVKTGPQYSYRIGCGVSTSEITVRKYRDYAKEVRITRWIDGILESRGASAEWQKPNEALRERLLTAAAWRLNQLPPAELSKGFDLLAAEGYVPELVRSMKEVNPDNERMAKVAAGLQGSQALSRNHRPAKIVGVMYHRYYDGGVERVMSLQMPMLQALGYEVVLFTDEARPELEYPLPAGINREVLPRNYADGRAEALSQAIARRQIDTMIYHQASCWDVLWDILLLKLSGVAVVATMHGAPWSDLLMNPCCEGGRFEFARPFIYRLADRLLVLSSSFLGCYESYGCNASMMPNPPTFDLRSVKVPPAKERQGVLWLGRLDERQKNWTDALRVMELLAAQAPDVQCWMGGSEYDAGALARLKAQIAERHLEKTVHWIGRRTDVQQLMCRCRVLLMTSSFEAFPMTLAEAKICGAPVVIYDMPYLEMLQSEAGCRVVRQRDAEAAASAAAEILVNDALCQRLSCESRASVEAFYREHDWPTMWRQILEDPAGGRGAAMPASKNLQRLFELQADFVMRGPLQAIDGAWREVEKSRRELWDAKAREEARCCRKQPLGQVIKFAILGKLAITHRKRRHYREKLQKLFA